MSAQISTTQEDSRPKKGITTIDNIRVAYLNVRGLSEDKLDTATQWISEGTWDIVFLAETWFTNEKTYKNNPFYVDSSTRPSRNPKASRDTSGILLLANPTLRPHINTQKSEYHLTAWIWKINITAIYLPPSLHSEQFLSTTRIAMQSHVAIGDFNCTVHSTNERAQILKTCATEHGMAIKSSELSRLDHIWCKNMMTFTHTYFIPRADIDIRTDHGLVGFEMRHAQQKIDTDFVEQGKTRRFFLKKLDNKECRQILIDQYEKFSPLIEGALEAIGQQCMEPRGNDAQAPPTHGEVYSTQTRVDLLYDIIDTAITSASETALGSYQVDEMKKKRDLLGSCQMKDLGDSGLSTAVRIWKRSMRGRQCRIIASDQERSVISEAIEMFSNVYDSENTPCDDTNDSCFGPSTADPTALEQFLPSKLKKIIRKYPKYKSCGPDGLHARIYDTLIDSPRFLDHLSEAFTLYATTGTTPSAWNISNTCLLPKTDGATCPVTNTRPISLTNMDRRYFESATLRYLERLPQFQLHRNQAGFRRGFSTISQILLAHDSCKLPRHRRHDTSIFLDLTKAFDRVLHGPLISYLKKRGCNDWLLKLIHTLMMKRCRSHLIINGIKTTPVNRNRGVFQGSILAPLLFNMAMDNLAERLDILEGEEAFPVFQFFADDIRLGANSSQTEKLQASLDICTQWALDFGLSFGIKKCGVVSNEPLIFMIGDDPIPMVSSYKYLGIELTTEGIDWPRYWDRVLTKAEKLIKFMFSQSTPNWSHSSRLALVKTFILSLTNYCLGIYAHWIKLKRTTNTHLEAINRINELYDTCIEFVFGFKTPKSLLESMTNIKNIDNQMELARASTTNHVHKLASENPLMRTRRHLTDNANATLMWGNKMLSSKCFEDRNYSEWRIYCRQVNGEDETTMTLKRFIVRKQDEELVRKSTLVSYISSNSRTQSGRLDCALFIKDVDIRIRAIRWRTNRILYKRFCTICMIECHRNHVNVCTGIIENDNLESALLTAWQAECERRRRRFGSGDNFTLLDYLLNEGYYKEFTRIFDFLMENSET